MPYILLNHDCVPPGGFVHMDKETGAVIEAPTWRDLLLRVRAFLRGNDKLFPRTLEADLQDEICTNIKGDPAYCARIDIDGNPSPAPLRSMTFTDAVRFIQFVSKSVKDGKGFVAQEEAERRAAICATCPMNAPISGCGPCRNILGWITQTIGARKTSLDDKLEGCLVCGCSNVVAVHCDLEAQQAGIPPELNEDFPDTCWKKRKEAQKESQKDKAAPEERNDKAAGVPEETVTTAIDPVV